jgi:ubiquinone/menaquinone biosynthesis C-methylase UbiE
MSADLAGNSVDDKLATVIDDYMSLADDSMVAILPHALRIAVELGVAEVLLEKPLPLEALANAVDADAGALRRLLRALVTTGLFTEPVPGCFGITERGRRLCRGTGASVQSSLANQDSCTIWLAGTDSFRSGRPAFGSVHGSDFFANKEDDMAASAAFVQRMRERCSRLYAQVVEVVDWERSKTVADIGGGDGFLLERVLRSAGHLAGILFDQPTVIDLARHHGQLSEFGERCRLVGGSFFDTVPTGADTHLMCSVLHNWPDEQAVRILRNSRRGLQPGGHLLVVEMLLPSSDAWHPSKWSDLGMLVLTGGRERTAEEFAELFVRAGYSLRSVTAVPGSYFSLIEAV